MKYLLPFLLACTQPVVERPREVVIVEQLGDTTRVWIRNDGVECWIYYDGEFVRRERY